MIFRRLRKIPLSAYIIEDMTEYVRAHATYRFVVHDEEEEKPRILVGVFLAIDWIDVDDRHAS